MIRSPKNNSSDTRNQNFFMRHRWGIAAVVCAVFICFYPPSSWGFGFLRVPVALAESAKGAALTGASSAAGAPYPSPLWESPDLYRKAPLTLQVAIYESASAYLVLAVCGQALALLGGLALLLPQSNRGNFQPLVHRWSVNFGALLLGLNYLLTGWSLALVWALPQFHGGGPLMHLGQSLSAMPDPFGMLGSLALGPLNVYFLLLTHGLLTLTLLSFRYGALEERATLPLQPRFTAEQRCRATLTFEVLMAFLGLTLVFYFSCENLALFFLSFEASALPIFAVVLFYGKRSQKFRAAAYLLFFTLLSAAPLLGLLLVLYQRSGTLYYPELLALQHQGLLLQPGSETLLAFLAFFLPFGVKFSFFPLHSWLPEAHVEASTEGSMLLSGILLKLGFYGVVKCCLPICGGALFGVAPALLSLALVGSLAGSLATYRQLDLKKIIAYSSVVHMNLSLVGYLSLSAVALQGALFLNFSHAVISAGLFSAVGLLQDRTRTRNLSELSGLQSVMPLWSGALLTLLLANAGLPGTVGFVGEAAILWGCFSHYPYLGFLLLLPMTLMGLRNYLLYVQLCWGVAPAYLNPAPLGATAADGALLRSWDLNPHREGLVLLILAALSLLLGVWPNFLLSALEGVALQPTLRWLMPADPERAQMLEDLRLALPLLTPPDGLLGSAALFSFGGRLYRPKFFPKPPPNPLQIFLQTFPMLFFKFFLFLTPNPNSTPSKKMCKMLRWVAAESAATHRRFKATVSQIFRLRGILWTPPKKNTAVSPANGASTVNPNRRPETEKSFLGFGDHRELYPHALPLLLGGSGVGYANPFVQRNTELQERTELLTVYAELEITDDAWGHLMLALLTALLLQSYALLLTASRPVTAVFSFLLYLLLLLPPMFLLDGDYLGAIHLLVYPGAILIFFSFASLTTDQRGSWTANVSTHGRGAGLALSALLLWLWAGALAPAISGSRRPVQNFPPVPTTHIQQHSIGKRWLGAHRMPPVTEQSTDLVALGEELFGQRMLSLQLLGLLLLLAFLVSLRLLGEGFRRPAPALLPRLGAAAAALTTLGGGLVYSTFRTPYGGDGYVPMALLPLALAFGALVSRRYAFLQCFMLLEGAGLALNLLFTVAAASNQSLEGETLVVVAVAVAAAETAVGLAAFLVLSQNSEDPRD